MTYAVRLTADALRDLEEIDDWISANDSAARAAHVVDRIEAAVTALKRFPERGAHPRELAALGLREFRETFFKPYRIIYRVAGRGVLIYLIADGRRDLQTLLAARLFGGDLVREPLGMGAAYEVAYRAFLAEKPLKLHGRYLTRDEANDRAGLRRQRLK